VITKKVTVSVAFEVGGIGLELDPYSFCKGRFSKAISAENVSTDKQKGFE